MDQIGKELLEEIAAEILRSVQENRTLTDLTNKMEARGVDVSFVIQLVTTEKTSNEQPKEKKFSAKSLAKRITQKDRSLLKGLRISLEGLDDH